MSTFATTPSAVVLPLTPKILRNLLSIDAANSEVILNPNGSVVISYTRDDGKKRVREYKVSNGEAVLGLAKLLGVKTSKRTIEEHGRLQEMVNDFEKELLSNTR
jgi:hypothetical protein